MKDHIYTAAYHNSGARREISRCYPGTREAALKTISDWIADQASHCLWLHGPAGTGKSAIAYTVAEQCHSDQTLGAGYFFIRGSTDKPPPFFPTLAYQLVLAIPNLCGPLWTTLCEDPTVFDRSMSEQLDKLIVQPFLKLVDRPAHIVIVIDGLDECDCVGGAAIQADIVRLVLGLGKHSLPLRFIISSRPELEIRRAFESSSRPSLTRLPLDKTLHPDRDIRHFLCEKLGQAYEECMKDGMLVAPKTAWPSCEAIDQLVKKSSGHFIYVSTVVKFVQEKHANPVERLNAVLQITDAFVQSTAFRELDQLYLHILRGAENTGELARILRAIMYFQGHRASTSNLDAIFSCTGGVRFLLGNLRSIIEVTESSMVQFFHTSMNDFLMDPARSREFHLDLGQFQADLACEYTRLIVLFCPHKVRGSVDHGYD
ncbi:hypothetical protein BD779DRAFT_423675 [Infundibulicybe gibba]|nr:hypothetical protein BD779DRAFT_423675 [Infundibulicybe gibba]